jgi:hypothetical protein
MADRMRWRHDREGKGDHNRPHRSAARAIYTDDQPDKKRDAPDVVVYP